MKKFLFAGFIGLLFAFASCGFESGSIYGNVTSDNEAVEGATVKLYYEEGTSILQTEVTGADGYYEFSGLEADMTYDVIAYYDSDSYQAFERVTVSMGEEKEVNLALTKMR